MTYKQLIFISIALVFSLIGMYAAYNSPIDKEAIIPEQSRIVIVEPELKISVAPIDCVVLIETTMSLGSGVVISEDGIILTAGHMLEYGLPDKITFNDGTEWTEFEELFQDKDADIGLFKIKEVFQFPYLSLDNSNELKIGEEVWAIGMPFGIEWWHCYGYISKESEKGRLFISMPLNPGNSGCPILNRDNKIIGICTDGILPGNNIARGHTSNICSVIIAKYRILFGL